MKKKKLLLSLTLAAASFIALASCGSKNDDKSSKVSTQETSGDVETTESNASVPAGSTGAEETTGTNQNVSKVVVNLHANPSDISEVTGTVEVNLLSKDDKGISYGTATVAAASDEYFNFDGWFLDLSLTQSFTAETHITADTKDLYAKWSPIMETVVTGWAAQASGSVDSFQNLYNDLNSKGLIVDKKTTQDVTYGEFTILKSNVPEANTFNIQNSIIVTTSVDNAVLKLTSLVGGSSSGDTEVTVSDSKGTILATKTAAKSTDSGDLEVTLPTAGEYTISRNRAVRVSSITLSQVKQKSKQVAITAKIDESAKFIIGSVTADNIKQTIKNYVSVTANYENGSSASVSASNFDIDVTGVDLTQAGEYNVKVTSGEFSTNVTAKIYATESIDVQEYYINSGGTQNLRKVYLKGSEIDKSNIKVSIIAKCGTDTISSQVKDFTVEADLSTTGTKTVKVKFGDFEDTFDVLVVENFLASATEVNIQVDKNATPAVSADSIVFNSINDAVDYFTICGVSGTVQKTINIANGDYEEKVSIRTPNVKLVGETVDNTVIHYDGQAGYVDVANAVWGNGGSAVIFTTTAATGFEVYNLTIKNDNDNYDKMKSDASNYSSGTNSTQAVALYNQSDKSIIRNCIIKSCHDTLYNRGRQFYDNCVIYGTTDYIFGDTTTSYFYRCEIITVTSETKDGTFGYVGCNNTNGTVETASDYNYGYIFNQCIFSHQGKVADGANSLGRTWKNSSIKDASGKEYASMKQVIMNSIIDSSYRTDDERYTEMQGFKTNPDWVLEYNNTGSVITASTAEVALITDSTIAAKYVDFNTIFKLGDDIWTPGNVVVDDKTYYYFNEGEGSSGTSYSYRDTSSGAIDTTFGGLTIKVNKCQYHSDQGGYTEVQAGTITFTVEANSVVTILTGFGCNAYYLTGSVDKNVIYPDTNGTSTFYFASAQTVTMTMTAKTYLLGITINPGEEEVSSDVSSILVTGYPQTEYAVGADYDLSNLVVYAKSSTTNTYVILDTTQYQIDADTVINKNQAGTYTVTVTYGTFTQTFDVVYVGEVSDAITSNTAIDFTTSTGIAAALSNPKLTWVGKEPRDNSGSAQLYSTTEVSFKVNTGATVTVVDYGGQYGNISVNGTSTNGVGTTTINVTKDGTEIVISGVDDSYSYIKSITITYNN